MMKFSKRHWIFLGGLGALLITLVGYNLYLLVLLGVWKVFLSIFGAALLLLIIVSCFQIGVNKRGIHLHHYQIGQRAHS